MDESRGHDARRIGAGANAFYAYWGKAGTGDMCHRLAYHSLDVAAVSAEFLHQQPHVVTLFSEALSADSATVTSWITFWIALHDLGKFAVSFQGQRPDLLQRLQGRATSIAYTYRHDSLGAALLRSLLRRHDALDIGSQTRRCGGQLDPWVDAVTGHHGQPPMIVANNSSWERCDLDAALDFVQRIRVLLLPDDARDHILASAHLGDRRLSWWLAGLAVLADWLGSNVEYFPYCDVVVPLADYWERNQPRARKAVINSGLLPPVPSAPKDTAALFGWAGIEPPRSATPLQHWAETVPLADGPQLFILEDVTGAGKTEAALELAQRLIATRRADGLFMGLPTMATANAMYERIAPMAISVFDPETPPSIVLAHAQRRLSATFRDSVLRGAFAGAELEGGKDETATARCAAWLADSNKKALLANVGVGTVDQALLAVVHARHQSLRLLGLYRKVLIVDEVHACDSYMRMLLERLLQFHASAGGSAVLLTATLPQGMKDALADAFCSGRGIVRPPLEKDAYPLATQVSDSGRTQVHVHTRPEVRRGVTVDYRSTEQDVRAAIAGTLTSGGCVCWVRNTVADALAAYDMLASTLSADAITLFHARFAMGDRLAIERRVLSRFGPRSRAPDRRGQLVIATQVIEQSLDVDFDLLITDLAPIDRVIQRAGRMQRHPRDRNGDRTRGPDQRGGAGLIVYGPAYSDQPTADWYRASFPRASYVYDNPGQLWLTARWLVRHGRFAMPDDARDMVESVFGEEPIPDSLQAASDASSGKSWAERNLGAFNAIDLESGYTNPDSIDWAQDDVAMASATGTCEWGGPAAVTRLGDPTATVRLARAEGGALVPWCKAAPLRDAWEASSVRMPAHLFDEAPDASIPESVIHAAEQTMGDRGRWSRLLILSPSADGVWMGTSTDQGGRRNIWQYDRRRGLSAGPSDRSASKNAAQRSKGEQQ